MKNEIVIYNSKIQNTQVEVKLDSDTVWLTLNQIVELFNKAKSTISEHIKNVFEEGELERISTVRNFRTVQIEGGRSVERDIEHFNLDVIISVGYRVKSKEGTQFRIWATNVLRDYMLKGYSINNRMNRIEDNVDELKQKVDEIDFHINSKLIPTQGIFFDGQIFDAYKFASDLVRSAKKSIVLIDNYIDDNTISILSKKNKYVSATLLTKTITKQLKTAIEKANKQYDGFEAKRFTKSHDRFLLIDDKEIYHLGASLKDLGNKWFAFSKMNKSSVESIFNSLEEI